MEREQARSRPSGGCGCLLLVIAAVVAVVSFGASAVIGLVAPNRGLSEEHAAAIAAATGRWEGSYVCDGKRRGLWLEIERAVTKGPDLRATLAFFDGPQIHGEPLGIVALKGKHTGTRLELIPDSWVKRAPGYRMVDLAAPAPRGDPLVMSGVMDRARSACDGFSVTKR